VLHVLDTILPLLSCATVFVQRKSTDAASTMTVIQSTTDALHGVHAIRNEHAFDKVYTEVVAFCRLHDIPVPDNSVPSAADPVTRAPRIGLRQRPEALDDFHFIAAGSAGDVVSHTVKLRQQMYAIVDQLTAEIDRPFTASVCITFVITAVDDLAAVYCIVSF